MHGISTIIVITLLTIIVISLVGLLYMFSSTLFKSTTKTAETSLNETTQSLLANMIIRDVEGNKILVRNVGQTELTNFEVFVENTPIKFDIDKSVLQPGEVATIKMAKIETSPGVREVPAGDISVTTSEFSFGNSYKDYQGYSADEATEIITTYPIFTNFTTPLSGFQVTATAYDADSLNEILYCSIYSRRTDDYYTFGYLYPKNVTYDPLTGNCTGTVTTFDTNPIYWYNYDSPNSYSDHSLVSDGTYLYAGAGDDTVYKIFIDNGTLASSQDEGTGTTLRGMSSDSEFLYFGDSNFNLTKVRKSDLQRNLTIKYGASNYPIYSTAVDDTGVYWGNSQYNITKVNKTNFAQKFWSVDYGNGIVYDLDIDSDYIYVVASTNISKINKTDGQSIWNLSRPLNLNLQKESITIDGDDLWIGSGGNLLWQINKLDGTIINYTNYTSYVGAVGGIILEINYDSNYLYLSNNYNSEVWKVNKAGKNMEMKYPLSNPVYGLTCDTEYCYSADQGALVVKFSKNIPTNNYKSGEIITTFVTFIVDSYGSGVTTNEAENAIP